MLGDGQILFVGDSDVDAETAKRAEVPFLLFTQGYRKAEIADLYHTAAFDSYSNFDGLVRKVLTT
jgi:phosphoglycolate phosphatase